MATKVPKPRNNGQWTEARYNSFVKSALRKARWPLKYEALREAQVGKKINEASGRIAMHFKCAECDGEFPNKQVAVDHIEPVVDPTIGFVDWNTFIERLYIELEGFQVLCHDCHTGGKTSEEKGIAAERRKLEKDNPEAHKLWKAKHFPKPVRNIPTLKTKLKREDV